MARTDLIADTLTIIRNAVMAKKNSTVVPASKMTVSILEILKAEGYIENYKEQVAEGGFSGLKVYLRYDANGQTVISGLRKISRPGLKVYVKYSKMPQVLRGFGRAIISTSAGLMTNMQAREKKLGGEVIFYIW